MATKKQNPSAPAVATVLVATAAVAWLGYGLLADRPAELKPSPPAGGLGKSSACFSGYYNGFTHPLSSNLKKQMNSAALAKMVGKTTSNLTDFGQLSVFNAAKAQMKGGERSVVGVVTREVLKRLMPGCAWDGDPLAFAEEYIPGQQTYGSFESTIWRSAWDLVTAAAAQVGFNMGGSNPAASLLAVPGAPGAVIGRKYLELPEFGTSAMELPVGRRVELLVGDFTKGQLPRPGFIYAERVYAVVSKHDPYTNVPIVEIIGRFNGRDVSPLYSRKHGFGVGKTIKLYKTGTTGIRRIFKQGVT